MKNKTDSLKALANLVLVNTILLCSQASASGLDANEFPSVCPAVLGKSCAPNALGKVNLTTQGNSDVAKHQA